MVSQMVDSERDQNIEDLNIFIQPPDFMLPENKEMVKKNLPPNTPLPTFDIKITASHIKIGIKGNPPFINVFYSFKILGRFRRESKGQ